MSGRVRITLVCSVCDARNYRTTSAARTNKVGANKSGEVGTPGKGPLELKKHCPTCGKHTLHRESK